MNTGDRQSQYVAGSSHPELDRQAWLSRVQNQAVKPTAGTLVRMAQMKGMQSANKRFENGTGHPIAILPGMGGEDGTKVTYAVGDVRVAGANYQEDALRENLGTPIRFGRGAIEIHYVDDGGVEIGSGVRQYDYLSRIEQAEEQIAVWHYNHIDEILRIPLYGRRGIGGGFFCFPEPEVGNGDAAIQPDGVNAFWRGENQLHEPTHLMAVGGADNEHSLANTDYLTARAVSDFADVLTTQSAARQEFVVKELNMAGRVEQMFSGPTGAQMAKRILFVSTEQVSRLKDDDEDSNGSFSFMAFNKALASSNMPFSSVFWSGAVGSIGGTVLVHETKWTAHRNNNGATVQRAVAVGADALLFAFGTEKWERLSGIAPGIEVKQSAELGALGRMFERIESPVNQGQAMKMYCRAFMGTKINRCIHPSTGDFQDFSRAVLTCGMQPIRADGQF